MRTLVSTLVLLACLCVNVSPAQAQETYDSTDVGKQTLTGDGGDNNPRQSSISSVDTHDTTSTIATRFNIGTSRWPVPWDPLRDNHVLVMGWNKNASGGPENPNDDAFGLHFEQYWLNSPGHPLLEFHYDWWQARTRTTIRPYTMTLDRSNSFVDTGWNINKMSFFNPLAAGAQWLLLTPNQVALLGTTKIVQNTNNTPFLSQLNAAKTQYLSLIYLDNFDQTVVGPSGKTQIHLQQSKLDLSRGSVYAIDGQQVVGPRAPAIANATDAASCVTQLNAVLIALRAHGLIAP